MSTQLLLDEAVGRALARLTDGVGEHTRLRMALAFPAAVRAAAQVFGVTAEEILGGDRRPNPLQARHTAMHLLHEVGFRLIDVARSFAKDHGTASYAFVRVERLLVADPAFSADYEDVRTAYLRLGGPLNLQDDSILVAPVLEGALRGRLGASQTGHVIAFVAGALLREKPTYTSWPAVQGLFLLSRVPWVRSIMERVLVECGRGSYIPLVAERAKKLGWYVEAA